jgi:hypothetical protein
MELMSLTSLAGSVFSTACTAYFWLVKVRREQPSLRAHLADRECYLGTGGKDTRQVGLKLGVIVANYSALPNALLGARLWVRHRDGGWREVENVSFDKQTPLPFNLPSMQTVLLRLNAYLSFPVQPEVEDAGTANRILSGYCDRFMTEPREIRIELEGLNERKHRDVLRCAASPGVKAAA